MEITEEYIIETSLTIIEKFYSYFTEKDPLNMKSLRVRQTKVSLIPDDSRIFYKHEGWVVTVNATEIVPGPTESETGPDGYILTFLKDGTFIYVSKYALFGSGSFIFHAIKNGDEFEEVTKEEYYLHHNFDFSMPEFERNEF